MRLLAQSDPANPIVPALWRALTRIAASPDPNPAIPMVVSHRVARAYATLAGQRWFLMLVLAIAGLATAFSLRELTVTLFADTDNQQVQVYIESTAGLLVLANLIASVLLVVGLVNLKFSRLNAYHWFRRAVLVSLLVAQPLAFYAQQWTALLGLALNLVLLSAIELGIARETARKQLPPGTPA